MTDIWTCDKPIPRHADHDDFNNYYIVMQECFRLQLACGHKHTNIEQTRMFLNNIDTRPTANARSMMEQLRGKRHSDSVNNHLTLTMLPGALSSHRSYAENAPAVSINACATSNQTNSIDGMLSLCIDITSDTDYIVNACRQFRNSNYSQQSSGSNNQVQHNRSMTDRPFRGRCNACNQSGYHARNCNFLKKLTACIKHMERNKTLPYQLRKHYKSQNNYTNRSNVASTLQDENFIPYDNVDPDIFLSIAEDIEVTYIVPTSNDLDSWPAAQNKEFTTYDFYVCTTGTVDATFVPE